MPSSTGIMNNPVQQSLEPALMAKDFSKQTKNNTKRPSHSLPREPPKNKNKVPENQEEEKGLSSKP